MVSYPSCISQYLIIYAWGPFLESPDNLTGPKPYFEVKQILAPLPVNFVSSAEDFIV